MTQVYETQVAIVGGGISGLWLLRALERKGYRAILLEKDSLGCMQTLASQGMIHGGIKYALGGFTTPASESIASMPDRWRDCIAGHGTLDLSDVRMLSDEYFLFSDRRLSSRITAFFGSMAIRGRVDPLSTEAFPECFANKAFKGRVYRLPDIVIDSRSLVTSLASKAEGRILKSDVSTLTDAEGNVTGLKLGASSELVADYYIFAAGAGNGELIAGSGLAAVAMQTRPLHQVMVKAAGLPVTYAHAVSAAAGARPRVTITTHLTGNGDTVWYLGGNLAESGVARDNAAQIAFARKEMAALFPWLDWHAANWRAFLIDRAEPAQENHDRPDSPFYACSGNTIVCWPTKLTLAPLLADQVEAVLEQRPPTRKNERLPDLDTPAVGLPPWETSF